VKFDSRAMGALTLTVLAGLTALPLLSQAQRVFVTPTSPADRAQAIEIFQQLVEINTTNTPDGNMTAATAAMQKHFLEAGFAVSDVHLLGSSPRKQNLVVRIKGTGNSKPVLMLCHIDVAKAEDTGWQNEPFKFVEKDGYYYGPGVQDMKDSASALVATFLHLHREGYRPTRDLILVLTADGAEGSDNGAQWLLESHRNLVDAAFVINPEAGNVELVDGKPVVADVEATKKIAAVFQVTMAKHGGHSANTKELNAALAKFAAYRFPLELNSVTRAYLDALAKEEGGQTAADIRAVLAAPSDPTAVARLSAQPDLNANFRTTCVATPEPAGDGKNARGESAGVNLNCNVMPGHSPKEVRQQVVRVLANSKLSVQYVSRSGVTTGTAPGAEAIFPPPPPLPREVFEPLAALVEQLWPGTPVVAYMNMKKGASDSIYFAQAGIPSYGFSAIALGPGDHIQGQDARLPVDSYSKSLDFYYAYLKALGSE
jgi:acetylornithine deacetylase/succinyl-diaminopimelate desuccinylase-like protein